MPKIYKLVSKEMKKQRNKLGTFNYDEYEVPSFADTCEGNDVTMEIVEIPDPEDQQIEHFFGQYVRNGDDIKI